MTPLAARPGEPLLLRGDPYGRGRAQAALRPDLIGHVRHAIQHRLQEAAAALATAHVRSFIRGQHAFTAEHYPEILAEIEGIADGFGLQPGIIFDYLHCSSAMDLVAQAEHEPDGCTAFAATADLGQRGAIVAKNRDYRPQHIPIQQVMRHADPAWGVNPNATHDCGKPRGPIWKVAWAGLADKWPSAKAAIENFTIDNDEMGRMVAAVDLDGRKVEDVVAERIDANEARWKAGIGQ